MLLLLPVGGLAAPQPAPASGQPLLFVENVGQFAGPVRFQLALRGATLFLADNSLWLVAGEATEAEAGPARQAAVRLSFPGANARPELVPQGRVPTHMAYFIGSDPRGWRVNVPVWSSVRYHELYPGVDLELASLAGALDLRLIARPGADLAAVYLRASGADQLATDAHELRMQTGLGELRLPLPRLLSADGRALPLPSAAALVRGDTVSAPFARAAVPGTAAAVAAASLEYSSFYGSSGDDEGDAVAVGPDGAAYIGGWTNSSSFPGVTGTFGAEKSGIEAVAIKLAPVPNAAPSYVVVAGGARPDYVSGIAVDSTGAAYLVGFTASFDFPTQNGFDTDGTGVNDNNRDAFVFKLSPDGSQLVYSTFAGGSANERGWAIAVDDLGAAYITGSTNSDDFPTKPGSFDTSSNGSADAFALKLSPLGASVEYSTYLGGGAVEEGNDIAVDTSGAAYITGYTFSSAFPAPNGFDSSHNGLEDAFVVKLSANGSAVEYGTFVGGTNSDKGRSIVVDGAGAAYVAGFSLSNDFPAQPTSYDRDPNGLKDAVVFKLAPNGKSLSYATYLGGGADDSAEAIAIGNQGQAYVTGTTLSANFPLPFGALDSSPNGSTDIFVAALSPNGATLSYGSYLGGELSDSADGLALDSSGDLVLTGFSESPNFPIGSGPVDGSYNGDHDIILVRLALGAEPADPVFTISGTIRDASNNPLPNISVQTNGGSSTTTGDDGVYRLVGLPAASYRVTPVQPGLTFQPAFYDVMITNSDVTGKDFDVPVSTFSIAGRVRNQRTGQGVSNALVRAGANYTATSDGNGDYRLEGLPAGSYTLSVSHNSYSFEPKQRQVTLASNLSGQNFDARDLNKLFASAVTFSKPGACQPDAFEPNDQRYPSANLLNSRLESNVQIRANLCEGDPNEEDNYLFHVNQPGSVQLQINFPASYQNKVAVLIYYVDPQKVDPQNPDDLTVQRCHNSKVTTTIWTPARCIEPNQVFTSSGDYIVRVYLEDVVEGNETYLLLATFN